MKITLHSPPNGYEAEAEFHCDWLRIGQHVMTNPDDGPFIVTRSHLGLGATTHILLTPKKRKYWLLRPVKTSAEASKSHGGNFVLGMNKIGEPCWIWFDKGQTDIQWLKITEHEE